VIVHVAGPTTGNVVSGAHAIVKGPVAPSEEPVFTHTLASVVPDATVNVMTFSLEDVTVIPGAGVPSQPVPTSNLPSMVGHCSALPPLLSPPVLPTNGAAPTTPTRAATTRMSAFLIALPPTRGGDEITARQLVPAETFATVHLATPQ
jgi:hypothetical protein